MSIYIQVVYIFFWFLIAYLLRKEYKKLFINKNDTFSFKKFKSYNKGRKMFFFICLSSLFLTAISFIFIFINPPKTNNGIIKTSDYEIVMPEVKEKTIEELEAESDNKKSEYYKMMHPEKFNTDSILDVEYKKSEEKFGSE